MADRVAIKLPSSLVAEREGAVAILRLNRPHKRNALDDETIIGIEQFFTHCPKASVRCCWSAKANISPPASICPN